MPFQPSTPEELQRCQELVDETTERIRRLVASGKKVHVIWDIDHVLVSGRSDDAFGLLGYSVEMYFEYEERLITEILEDGPWIGLASACGQLQQSQDIVTARSSFPAMRVMAFLLQRRLPARWQLFVGHQPKSESYRIILKSFEKDRDTHILSIDDARKHNDAFDAVVSELGMRDRAHSVFAPHVRRYTQEDLEYEIDRVMNNSSSEPYIVPPRVHVVGQHNRYVRVTPNPREALSHMFWHASQTTDRRAIVEQHRHELETLSDELAPSKPKTDDWLFELYELVRSPH
jgi:hypothetical protein